MDQHHEPQGQSMGRVLAFPSSKRPMAARSDSKNGLGAPTSHVLGLSDRWIGQGWMVLAWILAVGRLQFAVERREVFGAGDLLAFLVAVIMPMMRGHKIFEALSTGVRFLRSIRIGSRPPTTKCRRAVPKSA